jgi:hypothetical protein
MKLLPSPGQMLGIAVVTLIVLALVNNVTFLSDLTRRRVA